ncbi:MAG: hypothetical protein A3J54_02455 [Candidatus Ryanbacteria bacterium RIFCSPHIGHO2_02_FULL_45_13b]|uniref:Haloacid dehalogenase n=1 Tax=Candidatus Ryanbacteria bacterium RIFCSPHIGHO2_02_FULL_45_13b TaxID=1802117 RepID=A0A1G2G739_9BACT|nr:MAG: hypothetical protein A3J54_02455 [Candidatus Ryanbacteria bacterium RIFCSPHIGHO2_02_FULL_45_13b]
MKIIFDFDYTLFHTARFLDALCQKFSPYSINKDAFYGGLRGAYDKKHIFRPSHFLRTLAKDSHNQYNLLAEEFNSFCCSIDRYLYPDVVPFLRTLQKKHEFFLLTFGDKLFQNMKITGSGIIPYITRIIITENVTKDKEAYTISGVEPTIFVDDNPLALMAVKRYAPHIITVRMKREEGEHRDKSSGKEVDYEITSLTQLQTF